ncbi:Transcription factor, MADS-box [Cynara cardunculus var. scolymus]|uniref:Transcription factor, MADS-box n=1 Tax=Cynara cardunculus var. scolymus TaxID=59895 RepID=A0A103XMZ4_CYNCS|nr:Transcription factor, MADS-box [Cynara cardunculus var. scolymus]
MGRAKLRMELITEEKTRNTSYQNRKHGIIKKAKELSVLCDVDTAIIVYPPDSNHPEIWPENADQMKKTIGSYKERKKENRKRTYDLIDYFQDRKRKIEDEFVKARKRNMEAKYPTWFDELNGLSEGQLRQFAIGLENKEKIVRARLELKKRNFNAQMPFEFELENNQPSTNHFVGSYPSLDQVQAMNDEVISNDLGWFDDASNTQMSFKFGLNNNQLPNHNVGSHPSSEQVQACNHDLMSHVLGWFDDAPNAQMPFGFELKNNQPANPYVGSYPSLDQVQALNQDLMSQDVGWLDDAATSSFTPLKPEMSGFGHSVNYEKSKPSMPKELALED